MGGNGVPQHRQTDFLPANSEIAMQLVYLLADF